MLDVISSNDTIWGMILERIRQAIIRSGKTRYRISKDTGIDQAVLCKLMQDKKVCGIETADRLAVYLGLDLKPRQKKGR